MMQTPSGGTPADSPASPCSARVKLPKQNDISWPGVRKHASWSASAFVQLASLRHAVRSSQHAPARHCRQLSLPASAVVQTIPPPPSPPEPLLPPALLPPVDLPPAPLPPSPP